MLARAIVVAVAAAAAASAEEIGPVPVIPNPSSWNDTGCHSPSEPGCLSCCEPALPGDGGSRLLELQDAPDPWVENRWTGNCTGCAPGAPCKPGDCPCGNCFPGVLPWWNEEINHPNGPPAGCKPCSRCRVRDMTDYREIEFGTCANGDVGDPLCQPDGSCDCSKAQPPQEGDCAAPAPGIVTCACWCDSNQKMRDFCQLDPTPTLFPGPCAFDRMVAQSKSEEFSFECDDQGYYKLIQCGSKAPPALPPSPPDAFTNIPSRGEPQARTSELEATAGEVCWCSEPSELSK